MNFGPQRSLRSQPCQGGHTWTPIAPEPGRPGFMRYHCHVCGEQATMQPNGEPDPQAVLEARVAALETQVAALREMVAALEDDDDEAVTEAGGEGQPPVVKKRRRSAGK